MAVEKQPTPHYFQVVVSSSASALTAGGKIFTVHTSTFIELAAAQQHHHHHTTTTITIRKPIDFAVSWHSFLV